MRRSACHPEGRRGAANGWAVLVGLALGAAVGLGGLSLLAPALRKPNRTSRPVSGTAVTAPPKAKPTPTRAGTHIQMDLVRLNTLLMNAAGRIPGTVAIHVRFDGGGYAGVRSDEPMPAASLIKLPIMVVLQDAWKNGTLTRSTRDEESVRKAITVSDNPSADWLIDRLGMSQINSWLEDHGYRGIRLRHKLLGPRPNGPNEVTAEELTRMLLEIADGTLVSSEASAEMRGLLLAQTRRTRIPAGVPPAASVGNKTGTLRGITHDAAFVETPDGRRYALAILVSNGGGDSATSREIARLSAEVYELVAGAPVSNAAVTGAGLVARPPDVSVRP